MREKKLLIFMPSVEGGGVEKNFFLISNYLSKIFKDVSIITADKNLIKKKINKDIKVYGSNSKIWNTNSRYPKYFICLIYLIRFLITNKKVLVFSFQANLYAALVSKIFKCNVITRSNSSSKGWSNNKLKIILYKFFLNLSDKVIVNSLDFKKELDYKFKINSTAIYNPLNKSSVLKDGKKEISFKFFNKKVLKLITVGRLVDQKDQITILKAINLIKSNVNFRLLIIGRGYLKKELDEYIKKKKLNKFVKIIPFQKNPLKYIKKADLFLLSSKFEGLPNVLLEAQCLKKFIISTNCPTGPKEILMNGTLGDLVSIGNYKKISERIIEFKKTIKKPFIKNKINLAYKRLSRFDYYLNMNKYEKVIKQFIYFK